MKKKFVLTALALSAFALASCGNSDKKETVPTTMATTVKYSVTYSTSYGTTPSSVNDVLALPATLPVLTAEGYDFGGWYLDITCTQPAVAGAEIGKNVTLYAKWTAKAPSSFNISFVSGYGSLSTIENVISVPDTLPEIEDANHKFVGWYQDIEYTKPVVAGEKLTENKVFYAKWIDSKKAAIPNVSGNTYKFDSMEVLLSEAILDDIETGRYKTDSDYESMLDTTDPTITVDNAAEKVADFISSQFEGISLSFEQNMVNIDFHGSIESPYIQNGAIVFIPEFYYPINAYVYEDAVVMEMENFGGEVIMLATLKAEAPVTSSQNTLYYVNCKNNSFAYDSYEINERNGSFAELRSNPDEYDLEAVERYGIDLVNDSDEEIINKIIAKDTKNFADISFTDSKNAKILGENGTYVEKDYSVYTFVTQDYNVDVTFITKGEDYICFSLDNYLSYYCEIIVKFNLK